MHSSVGKSPSWAEGSQSPVPRMSEIDLLLRAAESLMSEGKHTPARDNMRDYWATEDGDYVHGDPGQIWPGLPLDLDGGNWTPKFTNPPLHTRRRRRR